MSNLRSILNTKVKHAMERISIGVSEVLYQAVEKELLDKADNGEECVDLTPIYNEYTERYGDELKRRIIARVERQLESEGVEVEHGGRFGEKMAWVTLYESRASNKENKDLYGCGATSKVFVKREGK